MAVKLIFRIAPGHLLHIAVPADLGQDRGRSDGGRQAVSLYNRAVGRGDRRRPAAIPVSVDQGKVCGRGKPVDGPLHGQYPGAEDIGLVDLPFIRPGHRPGRRLFPDAVKEAFPALWAYLLGVVESLQLPFRRQDHRRGIDRAGQRAGPGLIHTADQRCAFRPAGPFRFPQIHRVSLTPPAEVPA